MKPGDVVIRDPSMMIHPFSRLVNSRLTALDISVVAFAGQIDVCRATVFGWLAGDYQPEPSRYVDIAWALDVSLAAVALAAAGIDIDPLPRTKNAE